jgi:N-acetyl-gamma-glutamyl-phosphate reductase
MIKAGIIGGAGYTGGELIRILLNHPDVSISFVQSKSNAGNKISSIHTDLEGETNLVFSNEINENADVIFFCTGHGESTALLPALNIPTSIKIIDLSNDFRLHPKNVSGNRHFVYGLPEINKAEITNADAVANPGCFASAIQLAILPIDCIGPFVRFLCDRDHRIDRGRTVTEPDITLFMADQQYSGLQNTHPPASG